MSRRARTRAAAVAAKRIALLPLPEGPDDELEDEAESHHEPRVTGSPDHIWLVYGDLERDDTHEECSCYGEVTWCESAQFAADVRYTRTDLVGELVGAAVAAERDCRTCKHFRGTQHCHSALRCVGGSSYERSGVVQLWEAAPIEPAPF